MQSSRTCISFEKKSSENLRIICSISFASSISTQQLAINDRRSIPDQLAKQYHIECIYLTLVVINSRANRIGEEKIQFFFSSICNYCLLLWIDFWSWIGCHLLFRARIFIEFLSKLQIKLLWRIFRLTFELNHHQRTRKLVKKPSFSCTKWCTCTSRFRSVCVCVEW